MQTSQSNTEKNAANSDLYFPSFLDSGRAIEDDLEIYTETRPHLISLFKISASKKCSSDCVEAKKYEFSSSFKFLEISTNQFSYSGWFKQSQRQVSE